jgi:hypothetical protein
MKRAALLVLLLNALSGPLIAQEPPVIPVGLDAYRQWERRPYQRIGARTYMRSTYDRTGGNEGADASHFLYQTADDSNVSLDVEGPGMLSFVRTNHWHGSPWHYVVDGQDNVVQETSTATPDKPVANSVFLPAAAFPNPLAWTWADTKGADLSWVPIGFTNSFQMTYSRTHYGTGYYIYQQFTPGARLSQPLHARPEEIGYFHATYRDHPHPELGKDLVLLDTREEEGGGDWSGHLVGTSFIFSHNANLGTLEGDPRFFFDDSRTPQAYGTGTEEWGGGGDYWGGQNMTLPLAGHPTGATDPAHARNAEDKIESAYRFLLADLMPFGKNARIQLEHGGTNESQEHYETVTYWYGAHSPTLLQTDELHVGDAESERAHGYHSPTASAPYSLTSRYEWGVDTLHGQEIYPTETDTGRNMQGISEFTLHLSVHNIGVLLRRKLDYSFPNQRAEIYLADVQKNGDSVPVLWKKAGVWYLAGSNTCVYSNPRAELGETQHIVQTSNRRFRDDEFLLPRALTRNRTSVRVQVRFTPVSRPLFPGYPLPPLAWSEFRYTAYCYRMPTPQRGKP